MTKTLLKVDTEIERLGAVISAAENWSKQYEKAPEEHAELIKQEQKLETGLRKYFREFANERLVNKINWYKYQSETVKAFDVNVVVDETDFNDETTILMNVVHDDMLVTFAIGANAGETIYKRDLGLSQASSDIQDAARRYTAKMVKDINTTTKQRISKSIQTSIALGENQSDAAARLQSIINDPKRAGVIARTEAVNGYQEGLGVFAKRSGAIGHQWQDVGAEDVCAENSALGPIPINQAFVSGHTKPPAHPNCRCGRRLIYQNELDSNPNLFSNAAGDGFLDNEGGYISTASLTQPVFKNVVSPIEKNKAVVTMPAVSKVNKPITVYHGEGHNLNNGNYMFGNAYYVARDKAVAAEFGEVKQEKLYLNEKEILKINSQDEYETLTKNVIKSNPAVNLNDAFPAYVLNKGYRAVEIAASVDPLGGIAVYDPRALSSTK